MDADLLADISSLESALAALKPGARPPRLTPELEVRRHALLARHLGFAPKQPVPELQVIGDSHVAFFSGISGIKFYKGRGLFTGFFRRRHINVFTQLLPTFRCFHLGPSTAWKANEKGSSTNTLEKIRTLLRNDLPAGSQVLLSFGEIDCRAHLPRLVLQGQPAAKVVEATVSRLMGLGQTFRAHGCRVSFWGPPCVAQPDENKAGEFVAAGPYGLRAEITRLFGETLAQACQAENFGCANLAGTYHPWDEKADPSYLFDDLSHLSQKAMPAALRLLRSKGILDLQPAP